MAQFIVPRLTPKPAITAQSVRVCPRSRGRATATRTSALVASRSHTTVTGATSSKRFLANAAPSCTETIPTTTSTTGEGRRGTGPTYDGAPAPARDPRPGGRPGHLRVTMPRMPSFEISRSALVEADPARVYDLVADFHAVAVLVAVGGVRPGPGADLGGAERGVGAKYAWRGNRKAGAGTMTITAATPERIEITLTFEKPFKASTRRRSASTRRPPGPRRSPGR